MPSLQFSQCSLAQSEDVRVNQKQQQHNGRASTMWKSPWVGYKRLSYSSPGLSPKRISTFSNGASEAVLEDTGVGLPLFDELHRYFRKMDLNRAGSVDIYGFRTLVIELSHNLEPFRMNHESIRACFDEFDITGNGLISVEEFIVIMGMHSVFGVTLIVHCIDSSMHSVHALNGKANDI